MSASEAVPRKQQEKVRQNEHKWTHEVWESGWVGIPSVIIENQRHLKLTPTDIIVLLHLIKHWWKKSDLPHPSKKLIADCMGVNVSTVRRSIARMEQEGILRRIPRFSANSGQTSNSYDFANLVARITPLAQEATAVKKQRRKEDEQRRHLRKIGSTVVSQGD